MLCSIFVALLGAQLLLDGPSNFRQLGLSLDGKRSVAAGRPACRAILDQARAASERLRRAEYALKIQLASDHARRWQFIQARALLDELRPGPGQEDLRGFEWHLLESRLPRDVPLGAADPGLYAALSPDGSKIALVDNQQLRVVDATSGKTLFTGPRLPVGLAFSPDGKFLAGGNISSGAVSGVKVHDATSGAVVATLGAENGAQEFAFSPDGGTLIVGGSGKGTSAWDTRTWKSVRQLDKDDPMLGHLHMAPDGKRLAVVVPIGALTVRDLASGKKLFTSAKEHHGLSDDGIVFMPGGRELATSGRHGLKLLDAATGQVIRKLSAPSAVPHLCAVDDQYLIADWSLLDIGLGRSVACFERTADKMLPWVNRLLAVAVTPARQVCMGHADEEQASLITFPLDDASCTIQVGQDTVPYAGFAEDRASVMAVIVKRRPHTTGEAAEDFDRFLTRWDPNSGVLQSQEEFKRATALAFDRKKGAFLASGPARFTVRDLTAVPTPVHIGNSDELVVPIRLAPDGKLLALGEGGQNGDQRVVIRDPATGAVLTTIDDPWPSLEKFHFTPDSKSVVTSEPDLVLRDARSGKEVKRWKLPGSAIALRFNNAGSAPAAAVCVDAELSQLVLWDVDRGERTATLRGHAEYTEVAAFSPDGRTLATGGPGGIVRLWDPVTGHPRGILRGHPSTVYHLTFRPDGQALLADQAEGVISLWAVRAR